VGLLAFSHPDRPIRIVRARDARLAGLEPIMPIVYVSLSLLSVAMFVGGLGGVMNATLTDNLSFWPCFAPSASRARRVIRVGLAGNVTLGAVASGACVWALAGLGSFVPDPNGGQLLAVLGTSLVIGFGAGRLATNAADLWLLHQAVCRASAAPAAPPDTVRAMETAHPWTIYAATDALMPRPMETWRIGR
jgi:hypothetical protein